jgi:hypothetical protein
MFQTMKERPLHYNSAPTSREGSGSVRRRPPLTYQEANQLFGYVVPSEPYTGPLTRRALDRIITRRLRGRRP